MITQYESYYMTHSTPLSVQYLSINTVQYKR